MLSVKAFARLISLRKYPDWFQICQLPGVCAPFCNVCIANSDHIVRTSADGRCTCNVRAG